MLSLFFDAVKVVMREWPLKGQLCKKQSALQCKWIGQRQTVYYQGLFCEAAK